MKYYEIYNEYLRSYEFEIEINSLKNKENFEYIEFYIQLAFNLINFFLYNNRKAIYSLWLYYKYINILILEIKEVYIKLIINFILFNIILGSF